MYINNTLVSSVMIFMLCEFMYVLIMSEMTDGLLLTIGLIYVLLVILINILTLT